MLVQIEYENNDFVVVNKPAGLPVYSTAKKIKEDSVLSWLLEKYPEIKKVGPLRSREGEARDPERPGIVHRLDKQTSGLLIIARTAAGFEYIKNLFRTRDIAKEYLALVYGELSKHGLIDKPLTKIGQEGRSKVRVDEKGKPAMTECCPLKYYSHPSPLPNPRHQGDGNRKEFLPPGGGGEVGGIDSFTLVRVKLHTGRTHQIRVHFSSEGHPVMGDNLYGKPQSQKLSDILPRQFLHASRLEFKLPDGTWLEIESELPEDLQEVLDNLSNIPA